MLIYSIDPGLVNIGVTLFDTSKKTKPIVFADKVQLVKRMKDLKSEDEMITRCYALFFDTQNSEHARRLQSADVVLIEQQMKRKYLIFQAILGSLCFAHNKKHVIVRPIQVKKMFGTGSASRNTTTSRKRKGAAAKVVTKKTSHAANKKAAVEHATALFPAHMRNISATKRDDVADSLLQALWYARVHNMF